MSDKNIALRYLSLDSIDKIILKLDDNYGLAMGTTGKHSVAVASYIRVDFISIWMPIGTSGVLDMSPSSSSTSRVVAGTSRLLEHSPARLHVSLTT